MPGRFFSLASGLRPEKSLDLLSAVKVCRLVGVWGSEAQPTFRSPRDIRREDFLDAGRDRFSGGESEQSTTFFNFLS